MITKHLKIQNHSTSSAWTMGQVSYKQKTCNVTITQLLSLAFIGYSNHYHAHAQEYSGNLTIRVSPRVLPQIVSRIFAIILQDVLRTGHSILFKTIEMTPNPEPPNLNEVSLENWLFADGHEKESTVTHRGTLFMTGVMGWFIPESLIKER